MKLKYSFNCEALNFDVAGNLNVLGIFDSIHGETFPYLFPRMVNVNRIEFHRSEIGKHKFRANIVNDDGKLIANPVEGEINIDDRQTNVNIILEFNGLVFPEPGTYALDLTIDNQHVTTNNIYVRKQSKT
ncbi:MAG TPA: hypothetical protein VF941_04965 [Clostridia bacterium]